MKQPSYQPIPPLGRRGGGWVALQGVLFALALAVGWFGSRWPQPARPAMAVVAFVVFVAGVGLLLGGGAGLGRQLTPFPRPVDAGELHQDGLYGYVRHPIYGAVLLILLAWALATSPWALLVVAAATIFFEAKRRLEEAWLQERYPDYEDYRQRVRKRYLPFLW